MSLTRPTPTRIKVPLSHLTFPPSCQMRDVVVEDDAEYERAARRVCDIRGIDVGQYLGTMIENMRIVCSHGTDRSLCYPGLVAEYFEVLSRGEEFEKPLLVVKQPYKKSNNMVHNQLNYWVFSGFTRGAAYLLWEVPEVDCLVYDGTLADAEFYSLSENRGHGLRTGFGDKTKAVLALIASTDGMTRCRKEAEEGGGLALAMASACLVSSALVTAVLKKNGLRINGLDFLPLEEKKPAGHQGMFLTGDMPFDQDGDPTPEAKAAITEVVVVPSQPEPEPQPPLEDLHCATPQVAVRESAEPNSTPEPAKTSGDTQTESATVHGEVVGPVGSHSSSSNGQLPPLAPHRYAALMASLVKLSKEFTKAIRADDDDGARLREALGACKLLDFVPERVDKASGEVTPAHVDFIIFRGLVKVLDLAGSSQAKVAKIAHAYEVASGGFVPPAHVRRQKVKQAKKGKGGK